MISQIKAENMGWNNMYVDIWQIFVCKKAASLFIPYLFHQKDHFLNETLSSKAWCQSRYRTFNNKSEMSRTPIISIENLGQEIGPSLHSAACLSTGLWWIALTARILQNEWARLFYLLHWCIKDDKFWIWIAVFILIYWLSMSLISPQLNSSFCRIKEPPL